MDPRFIAVGVLILGVTAGTSGQEPGDSCPRLPSDSGFSWKLSRGPDFDVCYAQRGDESVPTQLIGVYLGSFPKFHPDPTSPHTDGTIGSTPVHWYRKKPEGSPFKVGLETIYPLKAGVAHIWLLSQNDASLNTLIKTAEHLSFDNIHEF
jgi:hypothetical protein